MANDWLAEILACPACDSRPQLEKSESGWKCPECGREYPVIDGIPHLVIKEGLTPSPKQK